MTAARLRGAGPAAAWPNKSPVGTTAAGIGATACLGGTLAATAASNPAAVGTDVLPLRLLPSCQGKYFFNTPQSWGRARERGSAYRPRLCWARNFFERDARGCSERNLERFHSGRLPVGGRVGIDEVRLRRRAGNGRERIGCRPVPVDRQARPAGDASPGRGRRLPARCAPPGLPPAAPRRAPRHARRGAGADDLCQQPRPRLRW